MSDDISGIPEYGQDALSVRDIFFAGIRGVHFFVEDADQENLYELLMRRCFPNFEGIEIFPQGGKGKVIEHALAGYRGYPGVRRVYVVDKDFDDLLGTVKVAEGLFYLEQYGVENFIVDEDSIVEICVQEFPKESRLGISRRIGYAEAMRGWNGHLGRLHRAFLLVQKFSLGVKNCGLSVDRFVFQDRRHVLDLGAISEYVNLVFDKLVELGVVSDRASFELEMDGAFAGDEAVHINGKFVIELLYHHLRVAGLCGHLRYHSLVYRLAGACSLDKLSSFISDVNDYISLERRSEVRGPVDVVGA